MQLFNQMYFFLFFTTSNVLAQENTYAAIVLFIKNHCIAYNSEQQPIVPDAFVRADGSIDIEQAETITCSGLDSYHSTQLLARLSYAKPDQAITIIE
jgi:hypothetical protein